MKHLYKATTMLLPLSTFTFLLTLLILPPSATARPPGIRYKDPDPANKYFHESVFSGHYSDHFSSTRLPLDQQSAHLSALIGAYLHTTTHLINVTTWLAHGTLLGWYWNGFILPWDSDVDVMVDEDTMGIFATKWNMSTWEFDDGEGKGGVKKYVLDVNPHWVDRSKDEDNKIDARFLDMESGLFIDITTLRGNGFKMNGGDVEVMTVKDGHHYAYDDVFPLRESRFEGAPAWVPFAYPEILAEEYGEDALVDVYHKKHLFDGKVGKWVPHMAPWLGGEIQIEIEGGS